MFAREYRLPATVKLTNSQYAKAPSWSMKFSPNRLTHNRYGFVIRKQVDKRAVVRNRIRRLFRSHIESMQQELKTGYDILFFLEKGIMEQQQTVLSEEIKQRFRLKHLYD